MIRGPEVANIIRFSALTHGTDLRRLAHIGYDQITLRRCRNWNRIFYYLIPVLLTGTGIPAGTAISQMQLQREPKLQKMKKRSC